MTPEDDAQTPEPADNAPEPPPLPLLPQQDAQPPAHPPLPSHLGIQPAQQAFPPPIPTVSPAVRNRRLLLAVVAPNILALLLLWVTSLILNAENGHALTNSRSGTYIMAEFVLIPLLMGFCAAFCLRETATGLGVNIAISFVNTAIAIGLSYLVLREGVICLIMVSPLLACFIALGGLLGRVLFRSRARKLQLSVAPVLVLLLVTDACSPHDFENAVTDVVKIHAPPERVWKYVIDYPAIQEKPDFWLWKVGLPAPVQSTATGHTVGAARRCVFQGDIAFDERLVEVEPNRKVTFDITGQPNDPEIMGHLDLKRGQMTLQDNHDGTTTLIGTSWYKLKVYPAAYYDRWTQSIMRAVHLRVMHQIQRLAERDEVMR